MSPIAEVMPGHGFVNVGIQFLDMFLHCYHFPGHAKTPSPPPRSTPARFREPRVLIMAESVRSGRSARSVTFYPAPHRFLHFAPFGLQLPFQASFPYF